MITVSPYDRMYLFSKMWRMGINDSLQVCSPSDKELLYWVGLANRSFHNSLMEVAVMQRTSLVELYVGVRLAGK